MAPNPYSRSKRPSGTARVRTVKRHANSRPYDSEDYSESDWYEPDDDDWTAGLAPEVVASIRGSPAATRCPAFSGPSVDDDWTEGLDPEVVASIRGVRPSAPTLASVSTSASSASPYVEVLVNTSSDEEEEPLSRDAVTRNYRRAEKKDRRRAAETARLRVAEAHERARNSAAATLQRIYRRRQRRRAAAETARLRPKGRGLNELRLKAFEKKGGRRNRTRRFLS